MSRRSIASVMLVVGFVAVDLAALRSTLPRVPNPGLTLMVVVLQAGLIRAIGRRGPSKVFWVGFEAGGWSVVLGGFLGSRWLWLAHQAIYRRMVLGGRPIDRPTEMIGVIAWAAVAEFGSALAIATLAGVACRSIVVARARPQGGAQAEATTA